MRILFIVANANLRGGIGENICYRFLVLMKRLSLLIKILLSMVVIVLE